VADFWVKLAIGLRQCGVMRWPSAALEDEITERSSEPRTRESSIAPDWHQIVTPSFTDGGLNAGEPGSGSSNCTRRSTRR